MAYQLQPKAPTIVVGGQTYAIGALINQAPDGTDYTFGVFVLISGGWSMVDNTMVYLNPGDLVTDMKAKGGSVKFLEWLVAKFNATLQKLFAGAVLPPHEPTNDDEVLAFIQASLQSMSFTLVNGVPVLK